MTQEVSAFTSNSYLHLLSETHMMEGEKKPPTAVL